MRLGILTGGRSATPLALMALNPVLDYDAAAGRTSTRSADLLLAHLRTQALSLQWILETHAHADHLSAAQHLRSRLGGQVAIASEPGRGTRVTIEIP